MVFIVNVRLTMWYIQYIHCKPCGTYSIYTVNHVVYIVQILKPVIYTYSKFSLDQVVNIVKIRFTLDHVGDNVNAL